MNTARLLLVSAIFVWGGFEVLPVLAENAGHQINVPCPEYRQGRIWSYFAGNEMFKIDSKVTVLENKGGKILIERFTKSSIPNAPNAPSQNHTIRETYIVREGGIVKLGGETIGLRKSRKWTYTSPMFVCGNIPNSWSSVKMQSGADASLVTVSVKYIESKTVSVPAGEFDVEVFEFTQIEKQKILVQNTSKQTLIQYVNAKFGIVKTVIDVEIPHMSTGAAHSNGMRTIIELVSTRN